MLQEYHAGQSSSKYFLQNCLPAFAKHYCRSVAKGMVVGKAPGGGNLVVGGGDGGAIPPEAMPDQKPGMVGNQSLSSVTSGGQSGSGIQVGFGNHAPTPKSSGLGEPLGS